MNTMFTNSNNNPILFLLIVVVLVQRLPASLAFSSFPTTTMTTTAIITQAIYTPPKENLCHRRHRPLSYSQEFNTGKFAPLHNNRVETTNDDDEIDDTIYDNYNNDDDDDDSFVDPIEEAFDNMKHPMEFMLMSQWRQWKFGI